jgi:tetratricopeptide (TPR) repeat protein
MLLHDQGQTEKGLELATQAITLGPDDPDAHYTLGILYAREENDEWAFAELHQTLCIDPHYMDAYYALSQLFLRQGNFLDAERILRLGFSKDPENLRLSLFYRSLKSVSDEKELDEFVTIYRALYGEVITRLALDALKDEDFEPNPALEIRYLRLIQNMMKREQPYMLPCADEKEHPYFKRQIARIQEEIEELEQTIQAAKEAAEEAAEEAEKESSSPEEK